MDTNSRKGNILESDCFAFLVLKEVTVTWTVSVSSEAI